MMKKLLTAVAVIGLLFGTVGCAAKAGFSAGKVSAGVNTEAHAWGGFAFNSDLKEANPVWSALTVGFVTVGSHAGFAPHEEGKWVTLDLAVGPGGSAAEE